MANKANRIRIIAGRWRGRKLDFPSIEGLRPTTDPIRETLFNWLQRYLPQANCLDLYAGSGALGFEAASRGARHVLMVEKEAQAIKTLQENKALLQADNVQLMHRIALDVLKAKVEEKEKSRHGPSLERNFTFRLEYRRRVCIHFRAYVKVLGDRGVARGVAACPDCSHLQRERKHFASCQLSPDRPSPSLLQIVLNLG